MWFSFAGYLSLLSFGLLFEEMGLIIKYHGIVMKIKWASDLGRYIDRTINGTLKWSINLKKIYVSLIKLTFIRHLCLWAYTHAHTYETLYSLTSTRDLI